MREAAITFAIRGAGAAFALGQQVLLARLMSGAEFGAYVTAVSWILALGSCVSLGLAEAAVRILPRYTARGRRARAETFFSTGWRMVAAAGAIVAVAGVALLPVLSPVGPLWSAAILLIAGLPLIALEYFLSGVARSMGWFRVGAVTVFVLRPLLISGACLALHLSGREVTIASAGAITILCMSFTTALLLAVFSRRLAAEAPTRLALDLGRMWLKPALPMLAVTGLEDLLPAVALLAVAVTLGPEAAGLFGMAERLLALAAFVQFAVIHVGGRAMSLSLTGREAETPERSLQRATLTALLAAGAAMLPTLALAPFVLPLFGEAFAAAYLPMCILAAGVVFRAAAAPAHEFMLLAGEHRGLVVINGAILLLTGGLIVLLGAAFGLAGAATAAAFCLVLRALLLLRKVKVSRGISALPPLFRRDGQPAVS